MACRLGTTNGWTHRHQAFDAQPGLLGGVDQVRHVANETPTLAGLTRSVDLYEHPGARVTPGDRADERRPVDRLVHSTTPLSKRTLFDCSRPMKWISGVTRVWEPAGDSARAPSFSSNS